MCEQALHSCVQVRNLQGKADLSAYAPPGFQLVDNLGLAFVKQFHCGSAHIEDQGLAAMVIPNGGWFEPESLAVELDQSFIFFGCERHAQFDYRVYWILSGHVKWWAFRAYEGGLLGMRCMIRTFQIIRCERQGTSGSDRWNWIGLVGVSDENLHEEDINVKRIPRLFVLSMFILAACGAPAPT